MILVCPINKAAELIAEHAVAHVVSLLGPETPHPSYAGIAQAAHLRLTFHDILQPTEGYAAPTHRDAERLVAFVEAWPQERPMLIHCWAGISRSTAAAYTALCLLRPQAAEDELAWELREAAPSATPNRLIVSLADQLLGRNGRMVEAIQAIGRGAEAFEGTPFILKP